MKNPRAILRNKGEGRKKCNKNWHVFIPAGEEKCVCGESTDNPLNRLAKVAKKYNL